MTILNVPFSQKNQAKSLGAKWNNDLKCWFVPDGTDIDPFGKWIPGYKKENSDDESFSLSDILFSISTHIKSKFTDSYWVKAEIASANFNRHLYLDLVEFDDSRKERAKVRGIVWNNDADEILGKFKSRTNEDLGVGMSVLMKVAVEFSEKFGVSFRIQDIDPSYTVGEMQVKVNDIINRLASEGIIEKNKLLPSCEDFTSVAVISPDKAAGLKDFSVEADVFNNAGICSFKYYSATFQGLEANKSITKAFDLVKQDQPIYNFDCIVFIRGGGSKSDLHFVNEYEIASQIVTMPIPVLVGIGHEIDTNIPDIVGNLAFDTPSKVINHISSVIINNALDADKNHEFINYGAKIAIDKSISSVNNIHDFINNKAKNTIESSMISLNNISTGINSMGSNLVDRAIVDLDNLFNTKMSSIGAINLMAENKVKQLITSTLQNNPISILNKGFSVVKSGGDYITSIDQVKKDDELTILVKDGSIDSTIGGLHKADEK